MTHHVDSLLLDANCLLNLYATGRLREIAVVLPYQFWVAGYVAEREVLYILRPGATDAGDEKERVDLSSLLEEGLIQLMRLEGPAEEASFVDLAADLDEGEAITGALALHRDCAVATDDRKACRVLGQLIPPITLASTLELLKLWAETVQIPNGELGMVMAEMQSSASYFPGVSDPLYEWWGSLVCRSGS
ncbi:MAG: hypothetical protein OXH73_17130 [Caldilineaceae bacterium]|nr:hypothetical protein [Caldilineaceae bacterium]